MGGARILISDDEALFRTSAADSLRARFRGVEVLEAEDGAAALDIMSRMRVNVLITDLQMPKLSGIELVARVSSQRMPVQIIVVSAHMTDQMRCALDDLGALAFVSKPIDLDVLHRAVERMLAVPRAHVAGVTLAGFVQLLEMEQQTCALRVSSPDGSGMLVFQTGRLVDAWTGELSGDAAALAILRFRGCALDVVGVLSVDKQRVRMPLSFLLLESARRADEDKEQPAPAAGSSEMVGEDDLDMAFPPTLPAHGINLPIARKPPALPPKEPPTARNLPDATPPDISNLLRDIMGIDAVRTAAVADAATGKSLGMLGEVDSKAIHLTLEGCAEMLSAKRQLTNRLGLGNTVEDILVTAETTLHLIRPIERDGRALFIYLVIDRERGNLPLARRALRRVEASWLGVQVPSSGASNPTLRP